MKKNRYSSHDTGGDRSGGCRRCFCHRASRDDKSRTETRKDKKEGKAYAGKYRMNILLDTNNKGSFRNGPCDTKKMRPMMI